MSLTDLASIGSLVSGLAVLVSLVYLAQQTRQNVRNSQALIQQGRAARIADTALRVAELRASDGLDKCFNGSLDVSAKDVARFLYICRAVFISAEDSFFQHEQGLLDDVAFASFVNSVKSGMAAPGIAAGWVMTAESYEPQFRDFMNRTSGDLNVPSSRTNRGIEAWSAAITKISQNTSQ
jgi:hypothetical protein